ncbi:hypothetical protein C8Q74DRAFT_1372594 [Fomes fomentarius]|nr:hypothetical protein C8Q74DRAFT_1372594 [Fomes fomentarius]
MEARLRENTQRVRDDIGNLASTIRDIETHFERVAQRIQAANARLEGRYDTVYQGWVRAREEFNELVRQSREETINVVGFMDVYAQGVLVDVDPNLYPDLRVELQGLLSQVSEERERASVREGSWKRMQKALEQFEQELNRIKQELMSSRNILHNELEELKKEEGDLRAEITQLESKISSARGCWNGFVQIVGLGTSSAETSRARTRLSAQRNRLSEVQTQENSIIGEIGALDALEQESAQVIGSIGEILTRLGIISNIWNMLGVDIGLLEQQLATALNPRLPMTRLFQRKIQATRKLYSLLCVLLRAYVEGYIPSD